MNPEIAKLALQFLDRVDLKGGEVEAFVAVSQGLHEIMRGGEPVRSQEAPYEEA